MDKILIEGLEVEACIGVYDWERDILQKLVFDLELSTDISAAAQTDDLTKTLDYKAISDRIIEHVSQSSFELIEALAESVAKIVLSEFLVKSLRLKLSKPGAVPQAKNVAVVIERTTSN